MSAVLLVRHGQASFGAADYDQLSDLGRAQSRRLGAALAGRGVAPVRVVRGGLRRHGQTAEELVGGAGWSVPVETDPGWDEFDHHQVLAAHTPPDDGGPGDERARFQRWFEDATARWIRGEAEAYDETFVEFTTRVEQALGGVVAGLGRGETAVVATSGGPVAWIAAHLLGGGPDLWLRLNPVTVNASVSTLVTGARGTTLVSLNEHQHLALDQVTYR